MEMKIEQQIKQTPEGNLEFATEIAWNALIERAMQDGLIQSKPDGLEYMPSLVAKQNFKDACKEILFNLGAKVE